MIQFMLAPDGRVPPDIGLQLGIEMPFEETSTLSGLCLVPVGAPLFEHRSVVENVVLLTKLAGRHCNRASVVHALRQVEIPDALHASSAASLQPVYRLSTWLAVAHLTEPKIMVLENPFTALDTESGMAFSGLLVEASRRIRRVVVIGSDLAIARLLYADVVGAPDRS